MPSSIRFRALSLRRLLSRPRRLFRDRERRVELTAELLESRRLLATWTVTNINDAGAGSLRDAITSADADATTPRLIDFNIASAGVQTITLDSELPQITATMTIDGTTQSGYAGSPLIEIVGTLISSGTGLDLQSDANTVRGLVLSGFEIEISIEGSSNTVAANYIGTSAAGGAPSVLNPVSNEAAVYIIGGSIGNTIGGPSAADGNLIAANGNYGVFLNSAGAGNVIQNNTIGTDAAGTSYLPNFASGIEIANTTGASLLDNLCADEANVVGASDTIIQGNFFGTTRDGSAAINPSSPITGLNVINSPNTQIGGLTGTPGHPAPGTGPGNVFGGNLRAIEFWTGNAGSVVEGNLIGTTADGLSALANDVGVVLDTASAGVMIGGVTDQARNIISGNISFGIDARNTGNIIPGPISSVRTSPEMPRWQIMSGYFWKMAARRSGDSPGVARRNP